MSNHTDEVFFFQEVALEHSHLLPEDGRKIIYFVTVMQGEAQKIVYIGFSQNLKKMLVNHHRKIEFEFLNRMGYQVNIFGIVLPDGISEKEVQSVHIFYTRVFQPKLNDDYNSFFLIQAEQIKKRIETCELNGFQYFKKEIRDWSQNEYEDLKKQIENSESSGHEKNTIINKIWEAGKQYLMVDI
jgi:hypothetical protein